ncbi:hypothetical protein M758_3G174800 [Ceratodon purpureus]|nr:hypothetical protein M758_3G174800 [Ceratodon purpureus]
MISSHISTTRWQQLNDNEGDDGRNCMRRGLDMTTPINLAMCCNTCVCVTMCEHTPNRSGLKVHRYRSGLGESLDQRSSVYYSTLLSCNSANIREFIPVSDAGVSVCSASSPPFTNQPWPFLLRIGARLDGI